MFVVQFTSKVKKYSKRIREVVTFAVPFLVVDLPVDLDLPGAQVCTGRTTQNLEKGGSSGMEGIACRILFFFHRAHYISAICDGVGHT